MRYSLAFAWRSLGEAHPRRGDFTRARAALDRCLDLCRTSEFHALMPATASSLALALARDGRPAEALALADELGMRPLAAHCHLGLGTPRRRAGSGREAEEAVRTAAAMFREMAMRSWLERLEAGLDEER
ncbi:MAG: tetratricopeptide repeat protein [Candidatus Rokubacteria bacterium]|nr:tetratricopeptide repeat protein [Candidatus Rokubacteria bacterium]